MKRLHQNTPIFNSDKELCEFLSHNLCESLKQLVKVTVSMMVKQEMEIFRSEFQKEFDKILQFNGYYQRNMFSTLGKINEIDIPRFRQNPDNLSLNSLNVFDSEKDNFLKLIQNMHFLGISTRKINKLCQLCFGTRFSKNKVSEVYQNWLSLLLSLKQRGLLGKNLKLVIADDNSALCKAANQIYPEKKIQVCIVHKIRKNLQNIQTLLTKFK
jgi:transposase-like protein